MCSESQSEFRSFNYFRPHFHIDHPSHRSLIFLTLCFTLHFDLFSLFRNLIDFHEFVNESVSWDCHTFAIEMPYAHK